MKKFLKNTQIVVKNQSGIVKVIDTPSSKPRNSISQSGRASDFSQNEFQPQSLICLSNVIDDCQVFVYKEHKRYFLIYIKKVAFKNKNAFIAGCTCNISDNFLVLNHTASQYMYDHNEIMLIKCTHIRQSVQNILNRFNGEMKSEEKLQDDLVQFCSWKASQTTYFNDDNTICASLCNNDGMILFVSKNHKWKCVNCNMQDATKCRHGSLLDIDIVDSEHLVFDHVNDTEDMPSSSSFELLSTTKFTSNFTDYALFIQFFFCT